MFPEHTFDYSDRYRFDRPEGVDSSGFSSRLKCIISATRPRPREPIENYLDNLEAPLLEPTNGIDASMNIKLPPDQSPCPTELTLYLENDTTVESPTPVSAQPVFE